jgi:hypothetical protein
VLGRSGSRLKILINLFSTPFDIFDLFINSFFVPGKFSGIGASEAPHGLPEVHVELEALLVRHEIGTPHVSLLPPTRESGWSTRPASPSLRPPGRRREMTAHVLRARRMVDDAHHGALEQRPEALDRVRMGVPAGVLALGVVDDVMIVGPAETGVGGELVGDDHAAERDVRACPALDL